MPSIRLWQPGARVVVWSLACVVMQANAGGGPRAQQPVFRAGVTMVPIDVRALDRNGKPVTDLTQVEFTILEDGVVQPVAHFSTQAFTAETGAGTRAVVNEPRAGLSQPAVTGATAIVPQTARVFLIVLGRGRLQVPNRGLDGVLHFVRHRLLPQDRVAILAYNRATDFTTNHAALIPILERYKKAHEAVEVKLTMHFSGLAGIYRPPEIPAFIQADVDKVFETPGSANARTITNANDTGNRTDAAYRRVLPERCSAIHRRARPTAPKPPSKA
jgi:VWFA-related protein